ncbi:hypothetical protein HKD37_17G048374 [Glycine soja]
MSLCLYLDHDDHDDVPERRRPTASARRQRVHQMTQDVPAEDAPDMAEDAPEMTADVQSADGAEGSHVDNAEGFPGGPRDPSVLISFADHVAHAVWRTPRFEVGVTWEEGDIDWKTSA